jgi:hypothetical protein
MKWNSAHRLPTSAVFNIRSLNIITFSQTAQAVIPSGGCIFVEMGS